MKKYFLVWVVIIVPAVIALASCGRLRKSIRPGFGPAIEGEEESYNDSVAVYYFAVRDYVVDGEVEIWVESNFLSQEYLFTLAAEIAAQYPVGIIKPLDYSEKKEGEFAGGVSVRITCFIKSDKIEIEERIITNDRIIIVRGICPRQKLMPAGSKRGYYIIFKKNYR